MTASELTPVPTTKRGTGPQGCSDPKCTGHRARCIFGDAHRWATWYQDGKLMRTADTYYCWACGGVCIGDES